MAPQPGYFTDRVSVASDSRMMVAGNESRTLTALSVLEKEIDIARESLNALNSALYLVLLPSGPCCGPTGCGTDCIEAAESPLVDRIKALTFGITTISADLREIKGRLTL